MGEGGVYHILQLPPVTHSYNTYLQSGEVFSKDISVVIYQHQLTEKFKGTLIIFTLWKNLIMTNLSCTNSILPFSSCMYKHQQVR